MALNRISSGVTGLVTFPIRLGVRMASRLFGGAPATEAHQEEPPPQARPAPPAGSRPRPVPDPRRDRDS
jgi:hypothetical protein